MVWKSIAATREIVDSYAPDRKRFLLKAEHLTRYAFARDFLLAHSARSATVYDVACGAGYGTKLLSSAARCVFGFDRNKLYLEQAQKYASDAVAFYPIDIDAQTLGDVAAGARLPQPNAVVSFETIEHLESPETFLNQVRTVLADNGYLLISVPNERYEPRKGDAPGNENHKHLFTRRDVEKLLIEAGFRILAVYGQPVSNLIVRHARWLSRILNDFATNSPERFEVIARLLAYPARLFVSLSYSFIFVTRKI